MKFSELRIPGAWLIEPEVHADSRGSFRRHFCAREFGAHGIKPVVAQGNISENMAKGTLRGFHYQIEPHEEAKTLSCLSGAIYDVILDLRPRSPTFLTWEAVEISARDRRSLHVPAGCANAWLTTEAQTVVHYYMSEFFVAGAGRGIRYNDPSFGFRWPSEPMVISERDRTYPDFDPQQVCSADGCASS
jgi:dTDP-4-dehydrorhamnose 3,5-epimerase